ncbi:hypothetical protein [Clostridium beijerinckii]|uniref:Uncharacterized protein n=1 Tax=Clostridium beijerinckii TaxID=1520 RepID=A0AAW3W6B1_CLOBE|nr:hypothetical protein [Clostridium beijerinckii]MBC2457317.1 hypothetical protein [Clostridium beijerinckii]MBC2474373.1 hypothetical protein [Clostridium beijerinckii]NOV58991.1 hypothetical protein [Clostridium beijerinckii]NOV71621.1 hypothetical protein [Clostridium beijerinckii]NOW32346.1 hypothetical protein [Clostridium beijerinckii]
MAILKIEKERKESILNNLKNWNLDGMKYSISVGDFDFLDNIHEERIVGNRIMSIFEYYFNQLEKAKEEIKGIFTEDEIILMLNNISGHGCSLLDNKELFIDNCCNYYFENDLYTNPELQESLRNKLNKLSEMQIHSLLCISKEIQGEFNVQELFGCLDNEESALN